MRSGARRAASIASTLVLSLSAAGVRGDAPASAQVRPDVSAATTLPASTAEPDEVRNQNLATGEALGLFRMTFYWVTDEKDFGDEHADQQVFGRTGESLARVGERFARALRMEGSGRTRGGLVLNWAGSTCGPSHRVAYRVRDRRGRMHTQYRQETTPCFAALDPMRYPFGMGVQGLRLIPYRTVAVDLRRIPAGTPLFVPQLAGMRLPDGTRHDGCVVAADTGGGIRGARLDFFVATRAEFRPALRQLPRGDSITVWREPARCGYARAYAYRPPEPTLAAATSPAR